MACKDPLPEAGQLAAQAGQHAVIVVAAGQRAEQGTCSSQQSALHGASSTKGGGHMPKTMKRTHACKWCLLPQWVRQGPPDEGIPAVCLQPAMHSLLGYSHAHTSLPALLQLLPPLAPLLRSCPLLGSRLGRSLLHLFRGQHRLGRRRRRCCRRSLAPRTLLLLLLVGWTACTSGSQHAVVQRRAVAGVAAV